jgi:hypothetical protein
MADNIMKKNVALQAVPRRGAENAETNILAPKV